MKKSLVVFGTQDYNSAIDSLLKSSENYFDNFYVFSKNDIDSEFYKKNKKILEQKRGAGYWLWKPYFINFTLETIDFGDIIFYVDAGNIFNSSPEILYSYFENSNGVILFDNRDGMTNGNAAQNFISCKKDCFVLMDCDTPKYVNGIHLNASYQLYQKTDFSTNFVREYLKFCQNENILTDTKNMFGENYSGYYDHRHDQSVLSLLAIKHEISPLVDPSEWGNNCKDRNFPQMFVHHRNKNYKL